MCGDAFGRVAENVVYRCQDFGTAAPVVVELVDHFAFAFEIGAIFGEELGFCVAETEDGLVDVSDGEEIIFASEEVDEIPLERVGVLEFVH